MSTEILKSKESRARVETPTKAAVYLKKQGWE